MAESDFAKALAGYDGWQVAHEQEPRARQAAGQKGSSVQIVVELGHYVASKRHDNGNTLVEFAGETPEEVAGYIAAWEEEQVQTAAPDTPLSKEAAESSALATRLSLISASARDAANLGPVSAK